MARPDRNPNTGLVVWEIDGNGPLPSQWAAGDAILAHFPDGSRFLTLAEIQQRRGAPTQTLLQLMANHSMNGGDNGGDYPEFSWYCMGDDYRCRAGGTDTDEYAEHIVELWREIQKQALKGILLQHLYIDDGVSQQSYCSCSPPISHELTFMAPAEWASHVVEEVEAHML